MGSSKIRPQGTRAVQPENLKRGSHVFNGEIHGIFLGYHSGVVYFDNTLKNCSVDDFVSNELFEITYCNDTKTERCDTIRVVNVFRDYLSLSDFQELSLVFTDALFCLLCRVGLTEDIYELSLFE